MSPDGSKQRVSVAQVLPRLKLMLSPFGSEKLLKPLLRRVTFNRHNDVRLDAFAQNFLNVGDMLFQRLDNFKVRLNLLNEFVQSLHHASPLAISEFGTPTTA